MKWWPFAKRPAMAVPAAAPVAASTMPAREDDELDQPYFQRGSYERAVKRHLERNHNLVLYGPARQGKTLLLARCIDMPSSIYVECRPNFKRTHIYRLILSSLGYSVTTSKKRTSKGGATIKFGLFGSDIKGDASVEQENAIQEIVIDLKNPSEVAHLISRIPRPFYVILNGFHMLNDDTKENLLFDLAFFTERSKMRYIILGTWAEDDYLEAIEPAVTGKLCYLNVPFWTESELRDASGFWHDQGSVPDPAILDEMIALAGGDIALFSALAGLKQASADSFQSQAEELAIDRSLRGVEARVSELLNRRELSFSFNVITSQSQLKLNRRFQRIPGLAPSKYKKISINPQTGRPFPDDREVAIDAAGTPRYIEVGTAQVVESVSSIGVYLLPLLYQAALAGRSELALDDLIAGLPKALPEHSVAISDVRVYNAFLRLDEAQRRGTISPPLLSVDAQARVVRFLDRRFYLVLRSMSEDAFDDFLERCTPAQFPRPTRRAVISADVPEDEQERLKTAVLKALGVAPVGRGRAQSDGPPDDDDNPAGTPEEETTAQAE